MYVDDTQMARNCKVLDDYPAASRIIDAEWGTERLQFLFQWFHPRRRAGHDVSHYPHRFYVLILHRSTSNPNVGIQPESALTAKTILPTTCMERPGILAERQARPAIMRPWVHPACLGVSNIPGNPR